MEKPNTGWLTQEEVNNLPDDIEIEVMWPGGNRGIYVIRSIKFGYRFAALATGPRQYQCLVGWLSRVGDGKYDTRVRLPKTTSFEVTK